MPTKLEQALNLADMGFYIHPLRRNKKNPALHNWQGLATRDPVQIKKWFSGGKDYNIGIYTGRFGDNGEVLIVVDVDNKGDKSGDASVLKLELDGKSFPPTLEATTANNGRHLLYRSSVAIPSTSNYFAPGLDSRSRGGNLVAVGSSIDGGLYKILHERPVAHAPKWMMQGGVNLTYDKNNIGSVNHNSVEKAFAQSNRRKAIEASDDNTIKLLDSALRAIRDDNADQYSFCIEIGMALASLKGSPYEDAAIDLFHNFCARSHKYSVEWVEDKWATFNPSDKSFRSIFYLAHKDGWIHPGKVVRESDFATLEDRTDEGNANILARRSGGNHRFVHQKRYWLVYEDNQWSPDNSGTRLHDLAVKVSQELYDQCTRLKLQAADPAKTDEERKAIRRAASSIDAWVRQSRSRRGLNAMVELAALKPKISISINELDRTSHLLGVANGVVDLRTGAMCESSREMFITKRATVAFNQLARAPKWEAFISEITGEPVSPEFDDFGRIIPETVGQFEPRPQLARYLQKLVGYFLTAETAEHKLFIVVGDGSNGKSVLFDLLVDILGDYAVTVSPKLFMSSSDGGNAEASSSAKARLAGARLALASEAEDRQRLEASVIKQHTGDSQMTARLMRENEFSFDISHKVVLLTNAAPNLSHLDEATRGRLHLIPFDRRWNRPGHVDRSPLLPDGDKNLRIKLMSEAEGVLAWAVRGAALYYAEGLEAPAEVAAMTNQYFDRQDPFKRWLDTLQLCPSRQGATASELHAWFERWRQSQNIVSTGGPESSEAMGRRLKASGYIAKSDGKFRKYPLRKS